MQNEFKHSGDLGDIIWSLPTMRALGGGILYLDPKGGLEEPLVAWGSYRHTNLNSQSIMDIKPVLEQQEYVDEVRLWEGNKVKYNLDTFRNHLGCTTLTDSHLKAFNLSFAESEKAWLKIKGKLRYENKDIVFSRSLKIQSNHTFWEGLSLDITNRAIFLGTELEYNVFNTIFRFVVLYKKTTMLELFQLIKDCTVFFGNASFPNSIAEGFKKDRIHEIYRLFPNTLVKREGVINV